MDTYSLKTDVMFSLLEFKVETTLLLLEYLNREPRDGSDGRRSAVISEQSLREVLEEMNQSGLVDYRRERSAGDSTESHGGIPEYRIGRHEIYWWELTREGRVLARSEFENSGRWPSRRGPEFYVHVLPHGWDPKDAVTIDLPARKILLALLGGPASISQLVDMRDVPGFIRPATGVGGSLSVEEIQAAIRRLESIGYVEAPPAAGTGGRQETTGDESVWKLTRYGSETAEHEWGKIG